MTAATAVRHERTLARRPRMSTAPGATRGRRSGRARACARRAGRSISAPERVNVSVVRFLIDRAIVRIEWLRLRAYRAQFATRLLCR